MAEGSRDLDAPRAQTALLLGLVALVVIGELLVGPPSAKAWVGLDVFLAAACVAAGAMLRSARLLGAGAWAYVFLGGAVLGSAFLPLVNGVWLIDHAAALLAAVIGGALLLIRR